MEEKGAGMEGGEKTTNGELSSLCKTRVRGYCSDALHQAYIETVAALDTPSNEQEHCVLIGHLSIAFVAFLIKEIKLYHN